MAEKKLKIGNSYLHFTLGYDMEILFATYLTFQILEHSPQWWDIDINWTLRIELNNLLNSCRFLPIKDLIEYTG